MYQELENLYTIQMPLALTEIPWCHSLQGTVLLTEGHSEALVCPCQVAISHTTYKLFPDFHYSVVHCVGEMTKLCLMEKH